MATVKGAEGYSRVGREDVTQGGMMADVSEMGVGVEVWKWTRGNHTACSVDKEIFYIAFHN